MNTPKKPTKFKESDMYEPIKSLLVSQGFIVRGEVKGCDIAAVSGEMLWVIEMKLAANITLIYQAMERQSAANGVFVAIPRPKNARDKNFKALQKLLKKLELGLITVAMDSPAQFAEVIFFPGGTGAKKTKAAVAKNEAIKKEIFGRTTDTVGGTTKKKINTAYRERCVKIACILEAHDEVSLKTLREQFNEKNLSNMMRANYFGWFKKTEPQTYEITDICRKYLDENMSEPLVTYYRMKAAENAVLLFSC